MKKSEWFLILFPLFFVWAIDHYTKIWASSIVKVKSFGYLHFVLSHNHGALLGMFADLPALLRIVTLSTVGTFLVFSYAAIQYILPIKSLKLRIGMSLLVGGIVGNVTDRIIWGYVIDFIILGKGNFITPPFNLADLIQWVGYFMICAAVLRDGELLWPDQNSRKRIWINPIYQYRYITLLIIIGLSLTLIGGVFSYTYLRVTITELIGKNNYISKRFLLPFLGTYITICLIFCFALVLMGRILSHRTAGPVFAFQKYLEDLISGKIRPFKLRTGDDFKHLEALAKKITPFVHNQPHSSTSKTETNGEPGHTDPVNEDGGSNNFVDQSSPMSVLQNLDTTLKSIVDTPPALPANQVSAESQLENKILPYQVRQAPSKKRPPVHLLITTSSEAYEQQEEG